MNTQLGLWTLYFACLTKTKTERKFNKFDSATSCTLPCALRCAVLCGDVNFVLKFYLRPRENKFQIVIYPKIISKFCNDIHFRTLHFQYTFSNFYILLFLFSVMFLEKSMECWHRYEGAAQMKMEHIFFSFLFFLIFNRGWEIQSLTVSHQQILLNRSFLNLLYHLDNTSMYYIPFCSSSFDVLTWVCNQNALFNQLLRNTGHRLAQVITSQLCISNKNWHKTCVVVT